MEHFFPNIVEYQPHSLCNANCSYCPVGSLVRENKIPSIEMEEKLLYRMIESFQGKELLRISPHLNTEPLLNKNLELHAKAWKSSFPDAQFEFSTNCVFLTEGRFESLVDAGVDSITLHFMGITKEIHESSMKTKYEIVEKNIKAIAKINMNSPNPIPLNICGHRLSTTSLNQWRKFAFYWKEYGVDLHLGPLWNRANWFGGDFYKMKKGFLKSRKPSPCSKPFNQIAIEYDGEVVLCSLDYKHKIKIGNIKDSSIDQIWNSDVMRKYRDGQADAVRSDLDLCKDCIRGGRYLLDTRFLTSLIREKPPSNIFSKTFEWLKLEALDKL